MDSHFLDLGTSWKWVVSFTPLPLYPRGKSPRYQFYTRLGRPPAPVWTTWRRENSWPYRDSNSDSSVVQPVASRYTDYTIPAPMCNISLCLFIHSLSSSWGGLVGVATGTGRTAGARDFSLLHSVKTRSGAHLGSCSMGIGVSFPGVERLGAWS
jgi:hypothetical protein